MDHAPHAAHGRGRHERQPIGHAPATLNVTAFMATLHCLFGCAIGEVAGLMIGTALGWSNVATIVLAVALAFMTGLALTLVPFLRRGYTFGAALRIAFAADAASITIMEIVDNGLMLAIPGAMDAPIDSLFFWASMGLSLVIAGAVAYPVNRWLIARGKGHAIAHAPH